MVSPANGSQSKSQGTRPTHDCAKSDRGVMEEDLYDVHISVEVEFQPADNHESHLLEHSGLGEQLN
ncbi:hypothetical protein WN944_010254 [Citrus x changshan-huyou]|uniref:Uncharacterized protein n=1 Tax=Citrus x changshan-huyou TaxID=2935761 RepID=A0AAP0MTS1_9ROSI